MRQDPTQAARDAGGPGVSRPPPARRSADARESARPDDGRESSRTLADPADRLAGAPAPLRGREQEMEAICRALDRARNARRATEGWIEGPRGIGKSRLLSEAERAASARGFTVVRLQGGEFSPTGSSGSALGAPGRPADAGRRANAPRRTDDAREDHRADGQAHVPWPTLLERHLEQAPLLVTCDEDRADSRSASLAPTQAPALRPVPTRLRNSPLVWLTTRRTEHGPQAAAAGAPQDASDVLALLLGPLSDEAVSQLFADCLGGRPDTELSTLLSLGQGNPRRLVAVVRQLREQGDVRVQDGTARVITGTGAGSPPAPRRVPTWFHGLMGERLATVSPQTRLLLEVATVLGPSCLPEDIAEMLGEPVSALVPRFREAVTAGMVQRGTETVTFRHDLMRQALADDMPGVVRGAMHRQALGMLMGRGSSPAAVATHLVHGAHRGDPSIAGLLLRAAEESVAGSPGTAADLALRGLDLVRPLVDESYEPLTVIAVEACVRSGALSQAVTLAQDALSHAVDPQATARLRYWLSTALLLRGRTSGALAVADALLADPGSPAALRRRAVLVRLTAWACRGGPQGTLHVEQALRDVRDRDPGLRAGVTTALAVLRWRAGRLDEALALGREAVGPADDGRAIEWYIHPRPVLASMLARVGSFGEAEVALEPAAGAVEFVSDIVLRLVRAHLGLANGRLDDAEREAAAGLAVAERTGARLLVPSAWMILATVARHRGESADVGSYARRFRDVPTDDRGQLCAAAGAWLEALVALAAGDDPGVERALEQLWANESGRRELSVEEPEFAPWLVRLLLARSRRPRAVAVSAAAHRLAETNPGIVVARAAADHARGLVDHDADALEAAAGNHRDAWARASAGEDLGVLLIDSARARAVRSLEGALALYRQVGAEGDAARVRRRLRTIGVRRRHWSHTGRPKTGWASLTRTERAVAEHVLEGMTNRQVAARMF
ncbi:AAA family ATPase, partial [Streptomyces sp. SID3343]|uniref:AAA family ATPase n=1 Tax=Streptomyces sp. SID3343 TaxID=2690260 RepID=UPI00136FB95F